jgi:hypothetical protein
MEQARVAGSRVHRSIRENEFLNRSDVSGGEGGFLLIELQNGREGELGEELSLAATLSRV